MNCYARLDNDILYLGNDLIERRFAWRDGDLATLAVVDRRTGTEWAASPRDGDLALPGEEPWRAGRLRVSDEPATAALAARLEVEVVAQAGDLFVRRVFRLYPGVAAIACDLYLRGIPARRTWHELPPDDNRLGEVEKLRNEWPGQVVLPRLDRLPLAGRHTTVTVTRFWDLTDKRNNLVDSREIVPFRHPVYLAGNIATVVDPLSGAGLVALKEAACSDVQVGWVGCDYVCDRQGLELVGVGAGPDDVRGSEEEWLRLYGAVVGVAAGGAERLAETLRDYQMAVRTMLPERDLMVMANTWGDRSQDGRMSEAFITAELEAARTLPVSVLQLDDGWQSGRSGASVEGGSLDAIWDRGDWWQVDPVRFPNGLRPVLDLAAEVGVEIGLWYNPSRDDSYANWRLDAQTLIGLYREHGVRIIKIDGVDIPDKRADARLRRMFDTVLAATDHEVTFNLDVTNSRRFGYHWLNEYGSIFLENRYTDWGNYYPHWTLRNLWDLAAFVPPQKLQIEFLNVWRNQDKYPADDPLAPGRVSLEYAFATTMAAQPLVWCELSNLPPEAAALAEPMARYRAHQPALHSGRIFPIGQRPDGTSWTGFQSAGDDGSGYLLVLRERNDRPTARVKLWAPPAGQLRLDPVLGAAAPLTLACDDDGRLELALPEPFSYGLWRYQVVPGGS